MIVELIIILILIAFAALIDIYYERPKVKLLVYVILGIVIFLYDGFKNGDLVTDYKAYEWMYDQEIFIVEPTFTLIAYFTKHVLGDNILWLFVIYAFIAVTIKCIAIYRLTSLVFLSLLIYCSDLFIQQELAQIRAAIATGILLLAVKPLYDRNAKKFAWLTLLAILFHISSIIMIPLWFLRSKTINKTFWVLAVFAGYALAMAKIDLISMVGYIPGGAIQEKYALYRAQQETGDFGVNIFSLLFIAKLFITLFLLWKSELVVSYNKYAYLLLKIMFISLLSLLLLSQNLAAGLRISEFYGIVSIILFPMLFYVIRPKWAAWLIIVILAAVFLYVRVFKFELISSSVS